MALLTALRRYQIKAQAERKAMAGIWTAPDTGYVFCGVKTGGPLNPTMLYKAFQRSPRGPGSSAHSPHTLRHSCASFLHAEGVPIKNISAYLGHADTATTNEIYIHLFDDALNDAAQLVERRISTAELAWAERAI
jgi:integrase